MHITEHFVKNEQTCRWIRPNVRYVSRLNQQAIILLVKLMINTQSIMFLVDQLRFLAQSLINPNQPRNRGRHSWATRPVTSFHSKRLELILDVPPGWLQTSPPRHLLWGFPGKPWQPPKCSKRVETKWLVGWFWCRSCLIETRSWSIRTWKRAHVVDSLKQKNCCPVFFVLELISANQGGEKCDVLYCVTHQTGNLWITQGRCWTWSANSRVTTN